MRWSVCWNSAARRRLARAAPGARDLDKLARCYAVLSGDGKSGSESDFLPQPLAPAQACANHERLPKWRYDPSMAKIDASRICSDALAELRERPQADPARELAVLREADRGDDWADYAAWPDR